MKLGLLLTVLGIYILVLLHEEEPTILTVTLLIFCFAISTLGVARFIICCSKAGYLDNLDEYLTNFVEGRWP